MPRRRKTTEPVAAEPAAAESKASKSDAIRAALDANPDKMPKEIAEILQAQGLDVTPQMVSTTKFNMKSKKEQPAATKAAPRKARVATKAADAVSLDSLKKAKELAMQLGGIKQAKAAIAALAELVD
jgi:hypothetical protein